MDSCPDTDIDPTFLYYILNYTIMLILLQYQATSTVLCFVVVVGDGEKKSTNNSTLKEGTKKRVKKAD